MVEEWSHPRYWQPGALWVEGHANVTISHNEITNVPYYGIRWEECA